MEEAFFLHSRDLPSPMGMNLTAFSDAIRREAVTNSFYGELLDWQGVLDLVERGGSMPHGMGQGQGAGGGHHFGQGNGPPGGERDPGQGWQAPGQEAPRRPAPGHQDGARVTGEGS